MTGTSISKVERAVAAAEDDTRTAQIGLRSVRLEVEHLRILPLLAYPFVVVFPPGARAESTPGTENRGSIHLTLGASGIPHPRKGDRQEGGQ